MLNDIKNCIYKYWFCFVGIIIFAVLAIVIVLPSLSEDVTSSIWDGNIATSFASGSGISTDPYQINTGSELAYFFDVMDEPEYFNRYYSLTNNIDLNGYDFSNTNTVDYFSGVFNGNGYKIFDFEINNFKQDEYYSYSLFGDLRNATVKNLNIENVVINPNRDNSAVGIIGHASGSILTNLNIKNIRVTAPNSTYKIAGLLSVDGGKNNISRTNIDFTANQTAYAICNTIDNNVWNNNSNINNVLVKSNGHANMGSNNFINTSNIYTYTVNGTNIIIGGNNTNTILNNLSDDAYTWSNDSGSIVIIRNEVSNTNTPIVAHASGTEGSTVYVNDFEADYDYYKGLNYTYSEARALPTREDKNIYNDSNLVYVQATYNGEDYKNHLDGNGNVGYVSTTEQFNKFVYYKVYDISNNGTPNNFNDDYVEFDLIDHPFADRPNNMGFNGWITDYNNAAIRLETDTYTRKVRIPITYTNGIPNPITIDFYASWTLATTYNASGSNPWTNAFNNLKTATMQRASGDVDYWDLDGLYYGVTLSRYEYYRSGDYIKNGNNYTQASTSSYCNSNGGCDVRRPNNDEEYVSNRKYYRLTTSTSWFSTTYSFTQVTPTHVYENYDNLEAGELVAGYYRLVHINNGASRVGLYDINGLYYSSGNCTTSAGCDYYELMKLKDNDGNLIYAQAGEIFYYLTTRDTNIIYASGNISGVWTASNQTKPFTLTAMNNNSYTANRTWSVSNSDITCNSDVRIEWIRLYSSRRLQTNDPSPSTSYANFYGNWKNTKLGRGITANGTYATVDSAGGGSATSTGSTVQNYTFIVESGFYNDLGTSALASYSGNMYIKGVGIYGSDFDRVLNDNSKLTVQYCLSAQWAGNIYSDTRDTFGLTTIVKSGRYGVNAYDYAAGVYIGGRGSGAAYILRRGIIEGGEIVNLIGGPLAVDANVKSGNTYLNQDYIYMKGGSADVIVGGAGASETQGNRIISVTGGTVNYAVFGGSNGVTGSDGGDYPGILYGSTFVYIGGHAVIGSETAYNNYISRGTLNSISKVEAGSVFGAGNGNSTSISVGAVNNSYVIIDGDALIRNNVYGGGNYGAVGFGDGDTNSYSSCETKIYIKGGTINGSVFGAANNNGSGNYQHNVTTGTGRNATTDYYYNVNTNIEINQTGGTILDSIYGGSNISGTVYGPTNLNIKSGTCNNIYGGGKGNNTFVRDNVSVNIGEATSGPNINGNVYGGSAFGTVNATSTSASSSTSTTNVTVNNGTITGSLYGGGQGSTSYTPYVKGNILVTINNGTISNVYGGFDQAGSPTGTDKVYLNGGVIGSAFGGGNRTNIATSNIYEQGSTVGYLYGGSNMLGNVNNTNVTVSSGDVNYLYGGNNLGGNVTNTNVSITGGNVRYQVYGGGNNVATTTTNVNITGGTVFDIFGGGNSANAGTTNVTTTGINANNIFGGSNASGTVNNSNVILNNSNVNNVYGGNNLNGTTTNSHVTLNSGIIYNLFGGGNEAQTTTTNVTVNNGEVTSVYGGGNEATSGNTNVVITGGSINDLYGGGNKGNITGTAGVDVENGNIISLYGAGNQAGANKTDVNISSGSVGNVYGGANQTGNVNEANVQTTSTEGTSGVDFDIDYTVEPAAWRSQTYLNAINASIKIKNNTSRTITSYNGYFYLDDSIIFTNWSPTLISESNHLFSFDEHNQFNENINTIAPGSTFTIDFVMLTNLTESEINFSLSLTASDGSHNLVSGASTFIGNVYGGNNQGGLTTITNVNLDGGVFGNVYGGGNRAIVNGTNVVFTSGTANNLYAGGNEAAVNGNTSLVITGGEIVYNGYGGGNEGIVNGNTNVSMNGGHIIGRIFAGGNGTTAIVNGNTNITISGNSIVGTEDCTELKNCSVFGSGNAASTGSDTSGNRTATVNIAGGKIYGNVYGGANTSVVYGNTITNIGANVPTSSTVIRSGINIGGTVFGGGEANAEGDAMFDFNAKSVTGGLTINIDGNNYTVFNIDGSVYGSGNASSSAGTSIINISNMGTQSTPEDMLSIQRADRVTITNSGLLLTGATDSENNYSDRKFSLSKIKKLYLKNNSSLYLENNALMLEQYYSVNNSNQIETLTINDDGTITRNVNNRIYMYEGKNLNISKDSNNQDYGDVFGMTFFGMYKYTGSHGVSVGVYGDFQTGEELNWGGVFDLGSYVQAIHQSDYETNGFYSNFINEDDMTNEVKIIVPQPPEADYHEWIIGESVRTYEIDLQASKYATLGTVELPFNEFYEANTTFTVLGFDYSGLASDCQLIAEEDIPRVASSNWIADRYMGISMKSSNAGWLNNGETAFLSRDTNNVVGTKTYIGDNSTTTPSLLFYFYHSKNISTAGEMGTVTVSMMVITKIDALTNKTERISININLSRILFGTDAYEGAITAGREYEMFTPTTVNITNKSSISAYYSLFVTGENPYIPSYKRALVTNDVLPEGTKITMIDLSLTERKYYYYVVTHQDVINAENELHQNGDVSYYLSRFQVMGAVNSGQYYNDAIGSQNYYNPSMELAEEEFIFIIDFEDTNITENWLNNSILFELQNQNNRTLVSVLGIQATAMVYNVYAEDDATIEVAATPDHDQIYSGDDVTIDTSFTFTQQKVGANVIYDTKSFNSKMGVEISLINSDDEIVTSTSLLGLYYEIDGIKYYPNIDGTTRIKLTEKVGNYRTWLKMSTNTSSIATGPYKLRFKTFASPDGIYYGLTPQSVYDVDLYFINEIYGLKVNTNQENLVINSATGHNDLDHDGILYNIEYNSALTNPNIRVKLYRRDYDTQYANTYSLVNLADYITNTLSETSNEYEYRAINLPGENSNFLINFKEELVTGTYKLEFILYDNNSVIGSVDKYFIIK